MRVHCGEINHRLQATYKHACSSNYRLPGMLRLTEHMQAILYIPSQPFYEVLDTYWEVVIMVHIYLYHMLGRYWKCTLFKDFNLGTGTSITACCQVWYSTLHSTVHQLMQCYM